MYAENCKNRRPAQRPAEGIWSANGLEPIKNKLKTLKRRKTFLAPIRPRKGTAQDA
jgi:hypothetical protein